MAPSAVRLSWWSPCTLLPLKFNRKSGRERMVRSPPPPPPSPQLENDIVSLGIVSGNYGVGAELVATLSPALQALIVWI